jgi:repressor LexA
MTVNSMTKRQSQVLQAIRVLSRTGFNPSLNEIAAHVGLAGITSVRKHLDSLTAQGYVRPRQKHRHRGISLTEKALQLAA